jgi:hypothetical protein
VRRTSVCEMCGEREKNRSEPRSEEEEDEEDEEDEELLLEARGAGGGDVPITPFPVSD